MTLCNSNMTHTETFGDILQFILHWNIIQLLSNGELPIDAFLGDVEALYIEEPILAHALYQSLR